MKCLRMLSRSINKTKKNPLVNNMKHDILKDKN